MKSSVARVLDIVQAWPAGSDERRAQMVRVSHELFDFDEISRRALSRHWKRLSPGEQADFVHLFTEVLERAFIASVDGYANDNSRWTVYDVLSEHVSLVASYRSQFNSVLRASSFADLLGRMRTDRLRRREPSTHMPPAPDPLADALFRHRGGVRPTSTSRTGSYSRAVTTVIGSGSRR